MAITAKKRRLFEKVKFFLLLLSITVLFSFKQGDPVEYKVKTVVIDAGHGGKDPGTSGKYSKEKDIALKVALKFGGYIEEFLPDVKVIYTRTDDTFLELRERAEIANKNNADVFISIHVNAVSRGDVYGTETYVMGTHVSERNFEVAKRENSVILLEENYQEAYENFDPSSPESYILFSLSQNAHLENSLLLASYIESQFGTRAGRKSRGVKQAGFQVLWQTSMPSVLVEIGYLTNEKEERELNDPSVQANIASGIFRAFRDYKVSLESMD